MDDIAAIGRRHLASALSGEMLHCDVSEWVDDNGNPVRLYWRPLTGNDQRKIEECSSVVDRTCMTVKVRARDINGRRVFGDTPLESLREDFDYSVIRAIAYLMATVIDNDGEGIDGVIEGLAKE